MKIKLTMKCHNCQTEHTFEYDTDDPIVYAHDIETKLSIIDVQVEEK